MHARQELGLDIHQLRSKNAEEIYFQNRSEQYACLDECRRIEAMHHSQRLGPICENPFSIFVSWKHVVVILDSK